MSPWSRIAACTCALALSVPAWAEDPGSREELMAIATDKNIALKLDKLIAAIEASTFDWTYEDVYTLVDMDHPPEVTKPAAGKAGMFYDDPRSIRSIEEAGRASAPAETIKISKNEDLVVIFETFNDVKYGIDAANREADSIDPRQSHESDDDWFLRKRKADEARVAKVAPLQGKVNNTSFEATLTGTVIAAGDCNKPSVSVDLGNIDFNLFRFTLGGKSVDLAMAITGRNVERVAFSASGGRRFEAIGTCTQSAPGSPVSFTVTMRRPFESDAWSGTAEFK